MSSSILAQEVELIFHDLFDRRGEIYRKIVSALAKGTLEFNQIKEIIGYIKSGVLSNYLYDLQEPGLISRDYTWLLNTKKHQDLGHFRLSDNCLRFYLKYIAPNKDKVTKNHYTDISLSNLPGWNSVMGLQFENLVLNNCQKIHKLLHIKAEDIVTENLFSKVNQLDYLIHTRFNILYICEIKFSQHEIDSDIIDEVQKKN